MAVPAGTTPGATEDSGFPAEDAGFLASSFRSAPGSFDAAPAAPSRLYRNASWPSFFAPKLGGGCVARSRGTSNGPTSSRNFSLAPFAHRFTVALPHGAEVAYRCNEQSSRTRHPPSHGSNTHHGAEGSEGLCSGSGSGEGSRSRSRSRRPRGGDSDLLVEETLESAAREHLGVAVANALASRVVRVDGARAEEFCARAQGDDAEGRVESGVERDDGGEDRLRATGAGSERSRRLGEGGERGVVRRDGRRGDVIREGARRGASGGVLSAPRAGDIALGARGHPAARVEISTAALFSAGVSERGGESDGPLEVEKIRIPFCPK